MINRASLMLAKEYYKPEIDLAFKLQEDGGRLGSFDYNPAQNNYVGINVYMPILLRKQRAKASQAQLKDEVISNKRKEALLKLTNAQRTHYQNTLNYKKSVDLMAVATQNYKRMLEAEQSKFNLGESSLFLVNSRELKWIESREKYIKSYAAYRKSILSYYHALGILPQVVN
jgi:outer membrane protein